MIHSLRISLAFLLVLFMTLPVLAADQVEVLSLQHRSAAEVLPQIEALLGEGERVSASGNHLVLIASEQTRTAVSQLVMLLDHPSNQFLVQIRWTDTVASSQGQIGYDGRSGIVIMSSQGTTLGTSHRQSGQQLLVMEGESAFIVTGQDIPYAAKWAAWSGSDSQGFAQTTAFQNIRSGFSVLIEMVGDEELSVQVTPQLMSASKGSMLHPATLSLDRLRTKIRVKAAEWVDLAGFLPDSAVGLQIFSGSEDPLPVGHLLQLRVDVQK